MFLKIKEESQKWRCQTMCVRLKCDFQNQSRLKKSLLHPKQIPEPQISGACVSAFAVLVLFHRDHSDATIPFAFPTIREASDHQCSWSPQEGVQVPLHAQEQLLNSSSWVDLVPNFRQEIRQSHYRNDPVKYDLNMSRNFPLPTLLPIRITFAKLCSSSKYWKSCK